MKWILIGRNQDEENIKSLKNFFCSKEIDCVEVYARENLFSLNVNEVLPLFEDNAYCVFFSAEKICENKDLLFLFGCVSASSIPTYFSGSFNNSSNGKFSLTGRNDEKLPDNFYIYADASKIPEEINNSLPKYLATEEQKEAYSKLFNDGLPFTPNTFAYAVSKEKKDVCSLYLKAGMDINSCDDEGTPILSIAVRNDCEDMVNWILDNGADINVVSKDRGYTPVMDAVWRKNVKLTKLLIEKGASLDTISKEGQSILVLAVGNGNAEICEMLLKNGADSETKDMMGMSARGYANLFKKPDIVAAFEKYPAK